MCKIIADPLYKVIEVKEEFIPILDSWPIQRLRYVRQLSFANLVYPSANHTRFEHSLGVAYLASFVAKRLDLDENLFFLAGLLHDTGHGPFAHAFEEVAKCYSNYSHEEKALDWLKELEEKISALGYNIKEIYKEIVGEGTGIIASEIDVDRLDYLQRDSYYVGNASARASYWHLLYNTVLVNGRIAFKEKTVPTIETILVERATLYRTVYYHKTTLAAQSLFGTALSKLIELGYLITYLAKLTDYQLISLFEKEKIREWELLRERKLPKLVAVASIEDYEELKEKLGDKLKVKIYQWPLCILNKIRRRKKKQSILVINDSGELKDITYYSKIQEYRKYLETYKDKVWFFAFKS